MLKCIEVMVSSFTHNHNSRLIYEIRRGSQFRFFTFVSCARGHLAPSMKCYTPLGRPCGLPLCRG